MPETASTELPCFFFDDLSIGRRFTSGTSTVDAAQITAFADAFDPQPFHRDPEAAKGTLFGGLAASGWHTAAMTMRLLVASVPLAGGIVGVDVQVSWPRPVRPGDTLHVDSEIIEIRPSRTHPDRGTVTMRSETRNQDGDIVQTLTSKLLVPKRPTAG